MPANFPEVWERRVRTNLTNADQAPWLDGIPELDAQVIEVGAGTEAEANIIHIPTSTFEPAVLINNTTYPINAVPYEDGTTDVRLDKYQTEVTTLSDDQVMGAAYDRIDAATRSHSTAITKKKYAKALHALAPSANAAGKPVRLSTGDLVNGRRLFTYDDLVIMGKDFDDMGVPADGRRVVLSNQHKADLLRDRKNFGDQLVNYKTGQPAPAIAGWEIFFATDAPYYTAAGAKVAFAAVPPAGATRASVFFYTGNIAKKTGNTKQYFSKAVDNPRTQANEVNYRHYYMNLPVMDKYIGATYDAVS
jgi:hypothetical protein